MAIAIAFANQKGGVGKSTLATQFAFYLAVRKTKKVLFIDMDAQASSSDTLLGDDEFSGIRTEDLFSEEVDPVQLKPIHTKYGVDLFGTQASVESYDVEALPIEQALLPAARLRPLFNEYDFVVIDCPPTLGRRLVSALVMVDYVVAPIKLSGYAISGLHGLLETIQTIRKKLNRRLKFLGAAVNEYIENAAQKKAHAAIQESLGDLVFKTLIHYRSPIDMSNSGYPIALVRNSRKSKEELYAVFEEILRKIKKLQS